MFYRGSLFRASIVFMCACASLGASGFRTSASAETPIGQPNPPALTLPGTSLPILEGPLIIQPGTGDQKMEVLGSWPLVIALTAGRATTVADYPGTLFPFVWASENPLKNTKTYDVSARIGLQSILDAYEEAISNLPVVPDVLILGFSQSAKIAGDAGEKIANNHTGTPTTVLLFSDPRFTGVGPDAGATGLENMLPTHMLGALGITMNGGRDTNTFDGKVNVVSYAIAGDPISGANNPFEDPVAFAVNSIAGYLAIHIAMNKEVNYATVNWDDPERATTTTDGNVTTVVYTPDKHPVTLLLESLGWSVSTNLNDELLQTLPVAVPGRDTPVWTPYELLDAFKNAPSLTAKLETLETFIAQLESAQR